GLAFAVQKLDELRLLRRGLAEGREAIAAELAANREALSGRQRLRTGREDGRRRVERLDANASRRSLPYAARAPLQRAATALPLLPTTTIGSFPQTAEIRAARAAYRRGEIDAQEYTWRMQEAIAQAVREQEAIGLDVLVHGEAERNDMVEYFGEQLEGFACTANGWVQSYGSRCVKPPIIYADVSRPRPMTVAWTSHAQSLTDRPMKGMLTGPVTLLHWSVVRDDQPRSDTCRRLAAPIPPPRSIPTCATRNSTTSSTPSPRWTPTSSPSRPPVRISGCWMPLPNSPIPARSVPACGIFTRRGCRRWRRWWQRSRAPCAGCRPSGCG